MSTCFQHNIFCCYLPAHWTDANKEAAKKRIEDMRPESCTNLWHGLRDGIKLFKNEANTGRVPAVMVLTDGVPNHMCPPQGYVPALKAISSEMVPSIHTFGFGYTLKSGLLKSIVECLRAPSLPI
jgi:Mg-chelatase subunit ChlD